MPASDIPAGPVMGRLAECLEAVAGAAGMVGLGSPFAPLVLSA